MMMMMIMILMIMIMTMIMMMMMTSCKVSLACPLGKMRMNAPCRASTCDHLQCFDAQLYLQVMMMMMMMTIMIMTSR